MRLFPLVVWLLASVAWAQADAGTARPVVSVLYFEIDDRLGELTIFRKGLAEMLITDLVESRQLSVVERSRLEEVLKEQKLQGTKAFDQSTAVRLGQLLGAQYQVTGTVLPHVKGKLLIDARVISVLEARVIASARAVVVDDDVLAGEQELVAKLLKGLTDPTRLSLTPPPKRAYKLPLQTAVTYAQALDAKDAKQPEKQKVLLTEVLKAQPDFILARVDLAALAK
ncbi:MAG: CsgG/HfaB family protein [Myxococcaceae bacterium]|jgi:TolB-like protein|nr:CsgG/HfaB family protein [Myxococcaceae bacterium]